MNPPVIGLTGYAQHGKDSVGNILGELGYRRFAFADPLKSMALALNPLICEERNGRGFLVQGLRDLVESAGWEEAKTVPEVRRFLQVLGTEAVRGHLGDDSWVTATRKAIEDAGLLVPANGGVPGDTVWTGAVVITDVRFPNEAEAIHSWGGQVWRIIRTNADGSPFDNGLGTKHPSEKFIAELPADLEIVASTIDQLRRLVGVAMAEEVKA